jgi:hypothetical protein
MGRGKDVSAGLNRLTGRQLAGPRAAPTAGGASAGAAQPRTARTAGGSTEVGATPHSMRSADESDDARRAVADAPARLWLCG